MHSCVRLVILTITIGIRMILNFCFFILLLCFCYIIFYCSKSKGHFEEMSFVSHIGYSLQNFFGTLPKSSLQPPSSLYVTVVQSNLSLCLLYEKTFLWTCFCYVFLLSGQENPTLESSFTILLSLTVQLHYSRRLPNSFSTQTKMATLVAIKAIEFLVV